MGKFDRRFRTKTEELIAGLDVHYGYRQAGEGGPYKALATIKGKLLISVSLFNTAEEAKEFAKQQVSDAVVATLNDLQHYYDNR